MNSYSFVYSIYDSILFVKHIFYYETGFEKQIRREITENTLWIF